MSKSHQILSLLGLALMPFSLWSKPRFVEGEYLVKVKNLEGKAWKAIKENRDFSIKRLHRLISGDFALIKVASSEVSKFRELINRNSDIEYAEPNYLYSLPKVVQEQNLNTFFNTNDSAIEQKFSSLVPNDPMFGELWGLNNSGNNEPSATLPGLKGVDINALAAWGISKGDRALKIAVIDTGIDYKHPDLKNNMWVNEKEANGKAGVDDDSNGFVDDIHGYDFANKDGDPMDGHGHGTHCAGTIGAEHDNGIGVAGVMDEVNLVAIKFLTDSGSGSTEDAILAIDYATKLGVDIMSNSWGGGAFSQALYDAILASKNAGILFVAAAGNDSSNNDQDPHYPSNYNIENVVSVAALNAQEELAYFSCFGKGTVHISAPGHRITSTFTNATYKTLSGTSMATPHMSGILGLLLSREPDLSFKEITDRILYTSIPSAFLRGKTMTSGRADAFNILSDVRPARFEPKESDWSPYLLTQKWESDHPYKASEKLSKTFKVPGAKFLRVVIKKLDLENKYDFINVYDSKGRLLDKMSGKATAYKSVYVDGEEIKIEFISDTSVQAWGFEIEELEAIF
jgi:thermitase